MQNSKLLPQNRRATLNRYPLTNANDGKTKIIAL